MEVVEVKPTELIKLFPELDSLPKCDSGYVEENGIIYHTYDLKNGIVCPEECAYPDPFENIDIAIAVTKQAVNKILETHKKVWVRIMPTIHEKHEKYYTRVRLAYKDGE
jgi:hypothetical protein